MQQSSAMNRDNLLRRTAWTKDESEFLRKTYMENLRNVGPNGQYQSKRELWEAVTACVNSTFRLNRTKDQCILQYTMLQRLENLSKQEPQAKRRRVAEDSADSNLTMKLDELAQNMRATLLEINDINERNNERRHKETLELISKCFNRDDQEPSKCKQEILELSTDMYCRLVEETADDSVVEDASNFMVESLEDEFLIENDFTILPVDEPLATLPETVHHREPLVGALSSSKKSDQREFQLVREKLLAMQRKKMEEIELKNKKRYK